MFNRVSSEGPVGRRAAAVPLLALRLDRMAGAGPGGAIDPLYSSSERASRGTVRRSRMRRASMRLSRTDSTRIE